MARVTRSDHAQQDLEDILDYLDSQRTEAAGRFAVKLEETCDVHPTHPQIGAKAEEYAPTLRHFTVWNYAIFYRPVDGGIELIRILHDTRDLPKFFG